MRHYNNEKSVDIWRDIVVFIRCHILPGSKFNDRAQPHPFPRIGDIKRHLIRQRPHFIADFLIRSIIGTFEIPTPPMAALTQA